MIEYLLVLTLTVALVLAVSKGVGKPLQEYMQKNVLDLVGCMLRVGQFPTKSFGLCQQAIQIKMDVASNFNSGGGSGSAGSSGDSSSSNSSSSDDGSNNTNGSTDGNSSDGDNGSDSGNSARVRPSNRNGSINELGNDSAFGGDSTKRIKVSNDDSSGDKELSNSSNSSNYGETTVIVRRIKRDDGRVGGSFLISSDEQTGAQVDGPKGYQAVKSQAAIQSEFDRKPSGGSFAMPKATNDGPSGPTKDEGVDFSFLGMIKWIIIIGVLFFIVVFAASQLNSIRKGWTD